MSQVEQDGPPVEELAGIVAERWVLSEQVESLRKLVIQQATSLIGAPSVLYGGPERGLTPEGFDCSGFVKFVLQNSGIEVLEGIRHTNEFFDQFGVLVHWPLHKRGDLVFFSRDAGRPTHMGIVLDPHRFVHAPGTSGSEVEIAWLRQNPIRRVSADPIYNTNPIGFKRLALPMAGGRWKAY